MRFAPAITRLTAIIQSHRGIRLSTHAHIIIINTFTEMHADARVITASGVTANGLSALIVLWLHYFSVCVATAVISQLRTAVLCSVCVLYSYMAY